MKKNDAPFSEWLQGELDKRKWTRADLARHSGLTPAALSHIMAGTRGLGPKAAAGIAKALGIKTEDVLRVAGVLDEEKGADSLQIRNTIALMRQLDDRDQSDIESMVRALKERRAKYS